jgi:hypothetical protein
MDHAASDVHPRFVKIVHQPLLQRQFVIGAFEPACIFIDLAVPFTDNLPDRRERNKAERFGDQAPRATFVTACERNVTVSELFVASARTW